MSIDLGVLMDPIGSIKIHKDSTFAMLLAAQRRGWRLWYLEQRDLCADGDRTLGHLRQLEVEDNPAGWYRLWGQRTADLADLPVLLMRKDPPFDVEYIYTTHLLEQAARRGCLVVNHPQSLRDCNEKLFTLQFPHCCPPTRVTRRAEDLRAFLSEQCEIVLKPLGSMGGDSVFRVRSDDPNLSVIIETLTAQGRHYTLAQRYLPEIAQGDKRILMVDGEPVPYALARVPAPGETRGNLAAGGRGEGRPLSARDRWIAAQVGPELRRRGILFAGLDVIGDFLTEINITSPTCIRELDSQFGLDIGGQLMAVLEARLQG